MPSPQAGQSPHVKVQRTIASRLLILGTLLAAALSSQPTLAYEQEVKQLSTQMAEVITKSGKKTVAVVDFTDLQGNVTELGRFLAEEFSVALSGNAKGFEVIDRTNLKTLLQEHKLASTGIIDPQTARRLGEIAGVQALITGNITPFGDSVRLSIKILDSATARVVGGFSGDIPRTKAIEELLAKGISRMSNVTTPQVNSGPPVDSNAHPVSQKEADFSFDVNSCKRSGTSVICKLLITNEGDDRMLEIAAKSTWTFVGTISSRMFDQAGNEYEAGRVRVGNHDNEKYVEDLLVSRVPTNAVLTFEGVSADATGVALLEIGCITNETSNKYKAFVVQMRNIPLGR
ncbi:MAG TPA: FlgO family outer membrane protein [Candidatus Acidoferrales bacterium]|nr:FlgO family outer membrane protein [Candidatus Acidoferrales bacterium]